MKKAKKNKLLTGWEKKFNKLISKARFKQNKPLVELSAGLMVELQDIEVYQKCILRI